MAIIFDNVRWKNFLSTGNTFTEINLNTKKVGLIIGVNGSGKCVYTNTPIRVRNSYTGEVFETTIGEFYEMQEKQTNKRKDN